MEKLWSSTENINLVELRNQLLRQVQRRKEGTPWERFVVIRQLTTVEVYIEQFEALVSPLQEKLSDEVLEETFFNGLKVAIKVELRMARVCELKAMKEEALLFDKKRTLIGRKESVTQQTNATHIENPTQQTDPIQTQQQKIQARPKSNPNPTQTLHSTDPIEIPPTHKPIKHSFTPNKPNNSLASKLLSTKLNITLSSYNPLTKLSPNPVPPPQTLTNKTFIAPFSKLNTSNSQAPRPSYPNPKLLPQTLTNELNSSTYSKINIPIYQKLHAEKLNYQNSTYTPPLFRFRPLTAKEQQRRQREGKKFKGWKKKSWTKKCEESLAVKNVVWDVVGRRHVREREFDRILKNDDGQCVEGSTKERGKSGWKGILTLERALFWSLIIKWENRLKLGLGKNERIKKQAHKSQGSGKTFFPNVSQIYTISRLFKQPVAVDIGRQRETKRNYVSWNSMLGEYGRNGKFKEKIEIYNGKRTEGIRLGVEIVVISACSHNGVVKLGVDIFVSMSSDYKIDPAPKQYSCLIELHYMASELDRAMEVINEMINKGDSNGNISMWGVLLNSCSDRENLDIGKMAAQKALEGEPHNIGLYDILSKLYAIYFKDVYDSSLTPYEFAEGMKKWSIYASGFERPLQLSGKELSCSPMVVMEFSRPSLELGRQKPSVLRFCSNWIMSLLSARIAEPLENLHSRMRRNS